MSIFKPFHNIWYIRRNRKHKGSPLQKFSEEKNSFPTINFAPHFPVPSLRASEGGVAIRPLSFPREKGKKPPLA